MDTFARLKQFRDRIWRFRRVSLYALVTLTVTGAVAGLRAAGVLEGTELRFLDHLFLLRPPEESDRRVVILEISESDIQRQGTWPWSDGLFARLLNKLADAKPAVVGIDKYLDIPVGEGRAELLQSMQRLRRLVNITFLPVGGSRGVELPKDLSAIGAAGFANTIADQDSLVRRALLAAAYDSFAFRVAQLYLEERGIPTRFDPKSVTFYLGGQEIPRIRSHYGGYNRINDEGYQVLINFRGGPGSFPRIAAADLLEGKVPATLLRDRIVLIGITAVSLRDNHPVAYSKDGATEVMYGVEIHANIVSQLVSAVLENRPFLQVWDWHWELLWIVFWAFLGVSIDWGHHRRSRWQSLGHILFLLFLFAGLGAASYFAFLAGWWIPFAPPALALGSSAIAFTVFMAFSATEIRRTFGRYLSDEVVASLLETPEGLKLGGERRKVTILMSDLRGFSSFAEQMPPEQVVTILNLYLGTMADIIVSYNGTIDEFIGDAVLAIFGAPTARADDTERAVACAIAMQRAMEGVNAQIAGMGTTLEMGIGINTGEVIVGNIGSQTRSKYAVVGSNVNLAGRIESYTVGGQVLISEFTFHEISRLLTVKQELRVEPKGVKQPISLYDVVGIAGKHAQILEDAIETRTPLMPAVPLSFTVLDGKHVVGEPRAGRFLEISLHTALLQADEEIALLSNLKIELATTDNESPLYVKVVSKLECGDRCAIVRFTSPLPEVLQQHINIS